MAIQSSEFRGLCVGAVIKGLIPSTATEPREFTVTGRVALLGRAGGTFLTVQCGDESYVISWANDGKCGKGVQGTGAKTRELEVVSNPTDGARPGPAKRADSASAPVAPAVSVEDYDAMRDRVAALEVGFETMAKELRGLMLRTAAPKRAAKRSEGAAVVPETVPAVEPVIEVAAPVEAPTDLADAPVIDPS